MPDVVPVSTVADLVAAVSRGPAKPVVRKPEDMCLISLRVTWSEAHSLDAIAARLGKSRAVTAAVVLRAGLSELTGRLPEVAVGAARKRPKGSKSAP